MGLTDIIIFILLLLALWQGYIKGMMKSLVGLLGNLLAIGITYVSYRPLGAMIDQSTKTISRLAESIEKKIPLPAELIEISADQSGVGQLYTYLEGSKLPQGLSRNLVQQIHETISDLGNNVLSSMTEVIALFLAEMIFYGILFIMIWTAMGVLVHLLSGIVIGAIQMVPILGSIDRIGGALVNGILFVVILTIGYGLLNNFLELSRLSGIMGDTAFITALSNSVFLAFFGDVFNSLWAILLSK